MSDTPANFSFPHRTPVFTAVLVLVCFAAFAWLAGRLYTPRAAVVTPVEGVLSPAARKQRLADLRQKEADAAGYAWIDQQAGTVRLPIDRAIELTARDHAKK